MARKASISTSDLKGSRLSCKMFGAKGDGVTDDTAALQACIETGRCYIPNGTYIISSTLRMRTTATIYGESSQGVTIKALSTATMTDMLLVGDDNQATLLWHPVVERLTFQGNATTTNGVRLRSALHAIVKDVRILDVAGAGLKSQFGVLNRYDHITVSVNEQNFAVRPENGIYFCTNTVGRSDLGESAATIINPIIEGPWGSGMKFAETGFCTVLGGSSEACGIPLGAGPHTTLTADIDNAVTTIPVASTATFPAAPFVIQIGSEWLTVSVVNPTDFTAARATPLGDGWPGGLAAAAHLSGAAVKIVYATGIGLEITSTSRDNRIYGLDLESNSYRDLKTSGDRNVFDGLQTIGYCEVVDGDWNEFRGGLFGQFTVQTAARWTQLNRTRVAWQGTHVGWPAAVFTNNSLTTRFLDVNDAKGTGGLTPSSIYNKTVGESSIEANGVITGYMNADVRVSATEELGLYTRIRDNDPGISGLAYVQQLISKGGNGFEIYSLDGPLVLGYHTAEAMRFSAALISTSVPMTVKQFTATENLHLSKDIYTDNDGFGMRLGASGGAWLSYSVGGDYYVRDLVNAVSSFHLAPGSGTAGVATFAGHLSANEAQVQNPSNSSHSVVTTDGTQTLTNKTISASSNTITGVTATGTAGGSLAGSYPNPTFAAVGTAGTYTKVTTNAAGQVSSGTTLGTGDLPSAALPVAAQNVVTGSRSLGVTYQNTTGKPMFVSVSVSVVTGALINAFTDASTPPTTQVGLVRSITGAGSLDGTIAFYVLAGNYYKLTNSGTVGINYWTEWD